MPIARLRGVVEENGDDWAIVSVGGLGILVSVPATTAEALEPGQRAQLYTYLHVREDALTLFGFSAADELRLFEQLIGVNGVGPKVALALLSSQTCDALAAAIVAGRSDVLRRVPGVGQKTAERIVLELREKVTPPAAEYRPAQQTRQHDADLIAALTALGYTQAEAADASARLPEDGDLPLEERIRQALALFSR